MNLEQKLGCTDLFAENIKKPLRDLSPSDLLVLVSDLIYEIADKEYENDCFLQSEKLKKLGLKLDKLVALSVDIENGF